MKAITKYLALKDLVTKSGGQAPAKESHEIEVLIEDVLFEIGIENKIVTKRLYKNAEKIFKLTSEQAVKVLDGFVKYLMSNNITEDLTEDWLDSYLTGGQSHRADEYLTEQKARAPKLRGRALKMRETKAQVMKELNKNIQFAAAKKKLLAIANIEARKIARDLGLSPKLVNLDKITIRNDD